MFKEFFRSVLKAACATVLAVVILSFVAWIVVYLNNNSKEAANAPLATLRTWPELTGLSGSKFDLETMWRGGRIYYQFDIRYSSKLRQSWNNASFSIIFLDKDGFKLFERDLPVSDMARFLGSDGQPDGVVWKGDESMDVNVYRRAVNWEMNWTGFPDTPSE